MNDISPSQRAKRKQIAMAVVILCGVFAAAAVGVYITTESAPAPGVTRKIDVRTKSYIAPGEKVDPQDAWRGVSDTRLNNMETKLSALETENRILKGRLGDKDPAETPGKSAEQSSESDLDKRLAEYKASVESSKSGYPGGTPSAPVPNQVPPRTAGIPAAGPAAGAPFKQAAIRGQVPGAQDGTSQLSTAGILTVRLNRAAEAPKPAAGQQALHDAKNTEKTTQNYLPSGMFGQAVLLSGLDAPTGGQAQSNPHPLLLQLVDLANLPNRYRYDWDRCLITAAAYGELSSERGIIRTESLSCVAKDGKVLDVPIKGYIVGEDGKAGMRGRLVSKQGQVLGNALLSGVVAGIGTGFERSSQIQSISPLGTTTTTKPGHEFQAGIGSGVGQALQRLSNYYISLAEKMFPVIEIDAQRVVDVVLTQGVTVDADPNNE